MKIAFRPSSALPVSLAATTLLTAVCMTVYEALKTALLPGLSPWESHTITIVFTSVLATVIAYFVFRRQATLSISIEAELTRRIESQQELEHLALHDPLTGLHNRTSIRDRIRSAIGRRKHVGDRHFASLFLDFDRFKVWPVRKNLPQGIAGNPVNSADFQAACVSDFSR